jgi:superfamily I DNA/RNA helicase
MPLIISDDDISWAEGILLPPGELFDEERRIAIRCLDTKDILACPGSGKTTALLAKLLILSRKMPLENNRGICVLTHTNVAINAIKKKASLYASKLFGYPNHFGTIQSFVDRFLAIPAYIERFHKRPRYIDNEIFCSVIEKSYDALHSARTWLDKKRESGLIYLKGLRFSKDDFCVCDKIDREEFICIDTPTYKEINSLKLRILEWGYLCYEDAYSLSFEYIRKHRQIRELFFKRFKYVFIDEMQDSNTLQTQLLNEIFSENVIIQKIGDLNQSIFDFDAELECGWAVNDINVLYINGSKRFSRSIANKVEKLGVRQQPITGITRQSEIAPVIIVYDDNSIKKVLDKFGSIIIRNNLHGLPDNKFKAVGWRGKPHTTERTIQSYWDGYSKEIQTQKTEFNSIKSYLNPQSDNFIFFNGVGFYRHRITEAFLKCLRLANITDNGRAFTEGKLHKQISENNPNVYKDFKSRLANWCLRIHRQEDILEEVKSYITNELRQYFDFEENSDLTNFLNDSVTEPNDEEIIESNNSYSYFDGTNEIEIEVATVHSVKGETHTATCYLETFFHDYDIKRIIEYVSGNYTKPTQKRKIQNLKMAFVGMSRPSHLLCVAVHRNHIIGHEEALRRNGWDVNKELIDTA